MKILPAYDTTSEQPKFDICIIGGTGHVGLPLGLVFASKGQKVVLYDINDKSFDGICRGEMPFIEYDAEPILQDVIGKTLFMSSEVNVVSTARFVIVAIGTPVDEFLNPKLKSLLTLFADLSTYLNDSQTIVIRSTVYPHTCRQVLNVLKQKEGDWDVAYCPERIAEGYAIRELQKLPQLVSGMSEKAVEDADVLFSLIAPQVIRVTIEEAELAKLFSNAWRYIQFAATNQFYMIAEDFGVNYNNVRKAMVEGYGRAANLPTAGFAAGPCLLKDTMQLAAFNNNNFMIGHAAMNVNEGLPGFVVNKLMQKFDLCKTSVGILGMAFKGDIDDIRDSLSYKLGKLLRFHGAEVYYSDEFAKDPTFVTKEELIVSSDIIIIGAPHSAYKDLSIPADKNVVDMWEIL
ncbi:nucleotide sugar dehydrogenase [Candidatus Latescibacterota bacterium]